MLKKRECAMYHNAGESGGLMVMKRKELMREGNQGVMKEELLKEQAAWKESADCRKQRTGLRSNKSILCERALKGLYSEPMGKDSLLIV
jgi:hypothetical protein